MMQIRLLASSLVAGALLGGCIEEGPQIGDALPRSQDVQVKVPDGDTPMALGDVAEYYLITRNVSRDLNRSAAWVLTIVHTVVQYPPTTVDGNVYTWGPHSNALEPSEWKLTVVENGGGESYDWALAGRDLTTEGSEFHTTVSGHAIPGADPHRGVGTFLMDFDEAELANPVDNAGQRGSVEVAYDLENRDGSDASIEMHIVGFEADEQGVDQPVEYDYSYAEALSGAGTFLFAVHGELGSGPLYEDAQVASRWIDTGAGRSQITIAGGDLGSLEIGATECWDTRFRRVYYADSQGWQAPEGSASDCAVSEF